MSRLTGSEVANLMQAYSAVYSNDLREEMIFEEFLTEEFILEAYQYVADFLVAEGHVPGYETAEVFMAEMDEHWIDEILCDYGLYLNEGPFGNFANTVIGGAKRAAGAVAGGVRKVAGAADKGVAAAGRAAQVVKGTAQRAAGAVTRGATAAGQAVAGGVQRAGQAAVKAATPVAQAVKGTAQRAVAAGQSALGGAAKAVQGAAQGAVRGATAAGQAVAGGAARAGQAVAGAAQGAARKIGQEIEISRKVGAGQPLASAKPAAASAGVAGGKVAGAAARPAAAAPAARPAAAPAVRPAAAAPAARPAAAAPAARPAAATGNPPLRPAALPPITGKPSLASQTAELRAMRAASQARQGVVNAHYEAEGEIIDETTLSAKEARAGKDIGKPGKQFAKIAASAAKRYGSEESGKKVAGAVLAKMREKANLANSYQPDNFDFILEYLVAEGHADTNEQAISMMANLTLDQIQGIIEQRFKES